MQTKIIQLTSGRGPMECEWVVAKVLKELIKNLKNNNLEYKIISKENGNENGTIQSVNIQLKGNNLDAYLKNWIGTIQWIGKSNYRKYNKRKNWFIGCFEVETNQSIEIAKSEIQFQAIRSSGGGGQHVNKVSSAIRAKHIKTGIQVLVMDSRSQHQNKKIAIERLKAKVAEANFNALQHSIKNQWLNHTQLERGNPVQVFTGTDFKSKAKDKSFKTKRNKLKNELRNKLE